MRIGTQLTVRLTVLRLFCERCHWLSVVIDFSRWDGY